jgi:PST family polysaccharide transporter
MSAGSGPRPQPVAGVLPPSGPGIDQTSIPPSSDARAGNSYGQILKSSVLIGGSSLFAVGVGIVRSKLMALILGPSGFGLMSLYTSITQLAQSIAGMGVPASGVRQIAAAVGTGDDRTIARTAAVLRVTSLLLGIAGSATLAALCIPVARLTFGDGSRAPSVALLSLTVLFGVVSAGQNALVHGLRRIADLARMGMLGAVFSAVLTLALVGVLRERGIVPSLVASAGATLAVSTWYSHRAGHRHPPLAPNELRREAGGFMKLGVAFLVSGMLMTGAAYLVRILVARKLGMRSAGLYQSAWAVGSLYVGFIIDAMGTDFYPRLTTAIHDHAECNRLVNEQAHVSLLLAGPGVLGTLVFAPVVLLVFYSSAFREAAGLLRWLCLGAALRVITFPMGFIVVAKARQWTFIVVEALYTVVYAFLSVALLGLLGIDGAGVAFFGSYVFHWLMIYFIVRSMTGFRWSKANRRMIIVYLGSIAGALGVVFALPIWPATAVGTVALLLVSLYSARSLARLVPLERVPGRFRWVVKWFAPAGPRCKGG